MDSARHLEILLAEGLRLAAMPADALDAVVPSCPDWTLERVVRHTGKVHQWVAATVAAGPDADLGEVAADLPGIPKGPDALPAYRESLEAVHQVLSAVSPDAPVPSFVGPGTAAFWCRRQAHEVAVHRIDAADAVHAAGGPPPDPLDLAGAIDGIDEWARVFLAIRWNQRYGSFPPDLHGRTVHVHCTDVPTGADPEHPTDPGGEWLFTFGTEAVTVDTLHAKGDVALRGRPDHLLLTLWRRRPLGTVDLVGDASVAERLHDLARF